MKTKLTQLRSDLLIALVEKTKSGYVYLTNKKRSGWSISIEQLIQYPKDTLSR